MRVIDPGHLYHLPILDGYGDAELRFVKREGPGYPFNVGHYPGVNCQAVLRALIDRVKYLQSQIPCPENELIIDNLREALRLFEERAAQRHGREVNLITAIETMPYCGTCGHIGCQEHGNKP